ncbi:MAG: ParB/RepB/Spo0J family partition protein [Gammaproteobacteria bacterium]
MPTKRPRLGRGLDALLGAAQPSATSAADSADETVPVSETLRDLPVDKIRRGRYQPRTGMREEALEELAASIRAQGVVQPIVVRPNGEEFEIIAGERRWRASQMAGLHTIPAVIRDVPDQAVMAMALIENIQREDLNPLEEALALNRLIDEFELTHQETADAVGRSRAAVSNLLRLLDLHESVKAELENRNIEMGHARALLGLPAEQQPAAARQVVGAGMNVRDTERLVRRLLQGDVGKPAATKLDPDVRRLQQELSEILGAKTEIKDGGKGKGRLVIQYNSLEELDGIIGKIR